MENYYDREIQFNAKYISRISNDICEIFIDGENLYEAANRALKTILEKDKTLYEQLLNGYDDVPEMLGDDDISYEVYADQSNGETKLRFALHEQGIDEEIPLTKSEQSSLSKCVKEFKKSLKKDNIER